jgi:ATP-binding cassette subfamily B protein
MTREKIDKLSRSKPANAVKLLRQLWQHLSRRRKKQLGMLLLLMLLGAALEIVSLGAIVPFLGALAAPDRVMNFPWVGKLAAPLGVSSADQLLLPITVVFGTVALASGIVRLAILWLNTRLAYAIGGELSAEAYRRTLYQPYSVHVARNSSVVVSGIIRKVSVATAVLYQVMMLTGSLFLLVAVMSALLAINAKVALIASGSFAAFYLLLTGYTRRSLSSNSQCIAHEEIQLVKALQEGLGGIRDVLLDATQEIHASKYMRADMPLRNAQGRNVFTAACPRYVLETVGILAIVVVAYFTVAEGGASAFAAVLPVLGALALGAQRLLPTLQQIYAAWAMLQGNYAAIVDVIAMLEQPLPDMSGMKGQEPFVFCKEICFKDVRYRYNENSPWVLDGVNIKIPKGTHVGIVGATGSGKSTVVDLLMGLLDPTAGRIAIDGQPISQANLRGWQECLTHVPQDIFLADASIAENIAFGVSAKRIDFERVRRAAQQAQLAEFIESNPQGYQAFIGERGVRLSGGQRQRIGIARALYKQASVLVLDEATSALDNETESMVMQTINHLDENMTILIVAHRLTTLRHCDRIIELVSGKAVQHESYEQMLQSRQAHSVLS